MTAFQNKSKHKNKVEHLEPHISEDVLSILKGRKLSEI